MACLSILDNGIFVACANPIFLTADVDVAPRKLLEFEVLESDSRSLAKLREELKTYMLDASVPFLARLTKLQNCKSTHAALSLMRYKPAMCGELTIEAAEPSGWKRA